MARFFLGKAWSTGAAAESPAQCAKPFRMMALTDEDEAAGPGWYESSRELGRGLQVLEDFGGPAALEHWHAEALRWDARMPARHGARQR